MRATNAGIALFLTWLLTLLLPTVTLLFHPIPHDVLFQLPPITIPRHAPYSAAITALLAIIILAVLLPFSIAVFRGAAGVSERRSLRKFPLWGYFAVCSLAAWSIISVTRIPFFAPIQIHTFAAVWYSFIAVMEALIVRRGGTNGWKRGMRAYARLFALSALFWWSYEYLNRYLQNWTYHGIEELTPGEYVLFASVSFATVLPATDAVYRYLDTYERPWNCFRNWQRVVATRASAFVLLCGACAVMVLMPIAADLLFPFAWLAPLGILLALQRIIAAEHAFSELDRGDWSNVVKWMCSGLICGFLWEMWNARSLAHWVYHVPYVQAFQIFEMPLLGFAGYLPFGLLCGAVISGWKNVVSE